jgi:hypothetical protein
MTYRTLPVLTREQLNPPVHWIITLRTLDQCGQLQGVGRSVARSVTPVDATGSCVECAVQRRTIHSLPIRSSWGRPHLTILSSRQGFGLETGFNGHLRIVRANNYNTIANFHTLQITTQHAKSFQSALTSCFSVTVLKQWRSLNFTDKVFSSQTPVQLTTV